MSSPSIESSLERVRSSIASSGAFSSLASELSGKKGGGASFCRGICKAASRARSSADVSAALLLTETEFDLFISAPRAECDATLLALGSAISRLDKKASDASVVRLLARPLRDLATASQLDAGASALASSFAAFKRHECEAFYDDVTADDDELLGAPATAAAKAGKGKDGGGAKQKAASQKSAPQKAAGAPLAAAAVKAPVPKTTAMRAAEAAAELEGGVKSGPAAPRPSKAPSKAIKRAATSSDEEDGGELDDATAMLLLQGLLEEAEETGDAEATSELRVLLSSLGTPKVAVAAKGKKSRTK